jgi:hypothetical protein
LQLRVLDEAGRYHLGDAITIRVENEARVAPIGEMTTPANMARVNGVIRISGYAYDPDGRVQSVTLIVDGVGRALATYGSARPEVCATLPNVSACPNIGFEASFDTRLLTNGLHRIGVQIRDAQGNVVTVPRTTGAGHNIFVEN